MARIKMWFCDELKEEIKEVFNNVVFNGGRINVYYLLQSFNPRGDTSHTYAIYLVLDGNLVKISNGLRYYGGGYDKVHAAIEDTIKHYLFDDKKRTYEQRQACVKSQARLLTYCIS